MYDRAEYARKKFRQVVVPLAVIFFATSAYVLFAAAAAALGKQTWIDGDLFEFSLVIACWSIPGYVFLRLIRAFVLFAISKSSPSVSEHE
jgi:hypothetical protein